MDEVVLSARHGSRPLWKAYGSPPPTAHRPPQVPTRLHLTRAPRERGAATTHDDRPEVPLGATPLPFSQPWLLLCSIFHIAVVAQSAGQGHPRPPARDSHPVTSTEPPITTGNGA